ncbi:TOBE domain-containing protein [Streptomyces pactum]|uniref:TOBE domain-containing protein n=1 Tax=Streptomyces pactum TaxID=68249 RepID=A0ABS0NPX9_9ACTN|nr:TOBE domain-containing protein [Streptomyces pactum]
MPRAGERILLGVRPEKISLTPADDAHTVGDGRNRLTGRISDSSFIGVSTQYLVAGPAGTTLSVYEQNIERDPRLVPGAEVVLHWNPAHGFGLRADRSPAAGAGPDEPPAGGPGSERPAAGARPGPSPEDGTPAGPSRAGGTGTGPSPATAAGPGQGAP